MKKTVLEIKRGNDIYFIDKEECYDNELNFTVGIVRSGVECVREYADDLKEAYEVLKTLKKKNLFKVVAECVVGLYE